MKAITPSKLYYDVVITNINSKDTVPPILYFNENRSTPFVSCPEDYYLSIVRFSLDTVSLPVFVCEIQENQPDVNLSIYSITLSYTNPLNPAQTFTFQQFLEFEPQNQSAIVPPPPSQTGTRLQNNGTGYYFIYTYSYFIYLVNKTFTQAFNGLNALVIGAGLTLPTIYPPILNYDSQNSIAVLYSDVLGYNTQVPSYIKIFFNSALFQLFSSFPVYITGTSVNGQNLQIQTFNFGGGNLVPYPPSILSPSLFTAIATYQEYSTIALWNPVTSIVFCSNTLPIIPSSISVPQLFINGQIVSAGGNTNNISNVITDFIASEMKYKPSITYNPSAQYRLIELVGNRPLSNLDIVVYWKDRTGFLNPFQLTSGSTATMKILFTKKEDISNYKSLYK